MRDFNAWLSGMRESINTYAYYIDFQKVYANVESLKIPLNILNALIGSKNIEHDFREIITKYPEVLQCIPLLLAVRASEIYAQDEEGAFLYNFSELNYSLDQYVIFMRKTGLFELIANHIISNIVDYVLGVETGLDSNGRKNRGGDQMENLVETYIKKTNVEYYKEMYLEEIQEKWNLDLSAISADDTSTKRFDFVVRTPHTTFLIETNFYSGGGSKLNETARNYKMLAEEVKEIKSVEFVWITDGKGWRSAKRNLNETFNILEHLYNINDMENGVFSILFAK